MRGNSTVPRRQPSRAGAATTTRPSASTQTCPSTSNSDLKPSAIATRTTAAKTRKLRSRSVVTVVAVLVYRSSEIGGVFIGPGKFSFHLPTTWGGRHSPPHQVGRSARSRSEPAGWGGTGANGDGEKRTSRTRAPVPILEPHHVLHLRCRDLEDVRVLDRRDAMARVRGEVHRIALAHAHPLELSVQPTDLDVDRTLAHEQPLVLALVVLKRQGLSLVDMDDLAQVTAGDRPADLVAPGFVDARVLRARDLRHALEARRYPPMPRAALRPRPGRQPQSRCARVPRCRWPGAAPNSRRRGRT